MLDEMIVIVHVQIEGIGSFYTGMLHTHIQYSYVTLKRLLSRDFK